MGVGDDELDGVPVVLLLAVPVVDRVWDGLGVPVCVGDGVAPIDSVAVALFVGVPLGVALGDTDDVGELDPVPVAVPVCELDGVPVRDDVCELEGVPVVLLLAVPVVDRVWDGLGVPVTVEDGLPVPVADSDGVAPVDRVAVALVVRVPLGELDGVPDGVGLLDGVPDADHTNGSMTGPADQRFVL